MRVVVIEERVFNEFLMLITDLIQKIERTADGDSFKQVENWLDTQDVCMVLHISKRQVQTLRTAGKLPFTQIGGKHYYKPADVQRLITIEDDL